MLAMLGACSGSSSASAKKGETPQQFLDKLDAAVRKGDVNTRVALLHPAVITRYGEQQCRDFLSSPAAQDAKRRDKVQRVGKTEPFDFSTDDGGIPVPAATLVQVKSTIQGKKSERDLHLARVEGKYRYFIDCGTPISR